MATPTLTNNTPAAGHISWNAFVIKYEGESYAVDAASTNARWVWWKYNNGSPMIEAGDDIPDDLVDDDLVLFGNKSGVGVRIQMTSKIDGELLVDGSIFAKALSTNLIQTEHIVTEGLHAGVIKFGTMSGARIEVNSLDGNVVKARTLLTSALIVSDMENLLDNPQARIGDIGTVAPGWQNTRNGGPKIANAVLPDGSAGPVFEIVGDGLIQDANNREIDVAPGDEFWVSGWVRKVSGTDTSGIIQVLANTTLLTDGNYDWTSPDDAAIDISTLAVGNWAYVEGSVTMPAMAYKTRFRTTVRDTVADGTYQFWGLQARRKANGKLIVDGTLLAKHIKSYSLTAEQMAADILVANEVYSREGYFGTLLANQIKSGAIDAAIGLLGSLAVGDISINPISGITIPGPKGDTVLSANDKGSRFAGTIETDDVTVDGGLTLNGETNNINGSLKLANVVVAPTAEPTITRTWPYTKPIGADTFHITEGLDLTSWVSVHWNSKTIRKYNKVTGTLEATFTPPADWQYYAVTAAKGYYYATALKVSTAEIWLCRLSATGTGFTALQKIHEGPQISGWMVGMGVDATTGNPMTAYVYSSENSAAGKIRVETWNGAAGTVAEQRVGFELYTSSDVKAGDWCFGVGRGNWGWDGEDSVYINTNYNMRVYDRTTKVPTWWPGTAEPSKGQAVTSTGKFVYVGFSTYRVYEWATENKFDGAPITTKYAWYDSKDAGSGKHETTPSPSKTLDAAWRWAWVEVTTPAPSNTGQDDSPDSVAIYLDNHRQPDLGPGVTKVQYRKIEVSNIAPKATNEFMGPGVASYPGQILSAATMPDGVTPRLILRGDGTGRWGDLTVDGAGKAAIGGDTGWIEITAFADTWENWGSPWRTLGCRRIGNQVYMKGLIRKVVGTGGLMFTLPAGFRPNALTMISPMVDRLSRTIDATGDGAKTVTSAVPNNTTTSHRHDVTITAYDIQVPVILQSPATRADVAADGTVTLGPGDAAPAAWVNFDSVSFMLD